MGRHITVLLLNLLTRVKCLITNNSNYIHLSGMTWHHMTLCCIVLYMNIYVSHNMDQVEALFSAFQPYERVRLKTNSAESAPSLRPLIFADYYLEGMIFEYALFLYHSFIHIEHLERLYSTFSGKLPRGAPNFITDKQRAVLG